MLLSLSAAIVNAECGHVPYDGCGVTRNTTFEPGFYNLPNGINIFANNIILDCNNAILIGNKGGSTIGVQLWVPQNVTVKNCVIKNYSRAISLGGAKNSIIKNNQIEFNDVGIEVVSVLVSSGGSWKEVSSDYNIIEKNTISFNDNGIEIYPEMNSTNNLIQNNSIFYNNKGIDLATYKEGVNFSNNVLKENRICYSNIEDIPISCQLKGIVGEGNACDKNLVPTEGNLTSPLQWDWNDLGTKGCTYTCDNLICGKATPGIKKGFVLTNWSFNGKDWNMATMLNDWLKSSKESFYTNWLNLNLTYDFEAIFELNISDDVKEIRISYSIYFLKEDNSINFSNEAFIYNFRIGEWTKMNPFLYLNGNSSLKRSIINFPINNNFINNNKIRMKFRQKNIDDKPDKNLCIRDPFGHCGINPEECFVLKLNSLTYQYCGISGCNNDICRAPLLLNLQDKNISQDSKPPARWIDLWNYVSDEDTKKENLKFSIESQSNASLINCWVDVNRYITCGIPAKEQNGYSDITVMVTDPQGLSDIDSFRVNVFPPTLTIIFVPFDWNGSYESYSQKVDEIAAYFLERIPLSNCSSQFKLLKTEVSDDYGEKWDGWKCSTSYIFPYRDHCFKWDSALKRIDDCGDEYVKSKNEKYNFIVGLSDNDIAYSKVIILCDNDVNGWSDGLGGLPSVIAEIRDKGTTTHEIGHEFGLFDQYCNCDNTSAEEMCGTKVPYSKLKTELGCNPDPIWGDCCFDFGDPIYGDCTVWCLGNFDRFGIDEDSNGTLDKGNRTAMTSSSSSRNHFDINEYMHLQEIAELQCREDAHIFAKSLGILGQAQTEFNLKIILSIDRNDNFTLLELNFTEQDPFVMKGVGEYHLRILNENNNILYQKNFSVDFIVFSDPPTMENESIVLEIVKYQESMKRLEIYHNNSLIFSYDIPLFCNYNGLCEGIENYISCPLDCKSNAIDDICNREKGDGCDLDCIEGIDSDCNDLSVEILNVSNTTPLSDDPVFIRINISNKGTHNLSNVSVEFFMDSISEEIKYFSIIANSSIEDIFKWKAKFGSHTLYFSVDNNNVINEINKTNNEQKIEINVSGIKLPAYKGWNLISIPLNLSNNSVNYLFKNNNVTIFGYKNNSWFIPNKIDNKLGYWIKLNQSLNLTLVGIEIENKTISLNKGWNLIGYPYLEERNISSLFGNVTVLSYNNSKWYSYNPNRPSKLNNLTKFTPGYGYWVKVK